MTKKEKIKKLLDDKPSYDRSKALTNYQNEFILKSNVNPRLFDTTIVRNKKINFKDRRESNGTR